MKLSILMPVYNDRVYVEQAIAQVKAVSYPIPYEIVAVDDGSTDGSSEILEQIDGIRLVRHKNNRGKGAAVRTGLQHVTGDIVAIQDDDCEYDPAVLPVLIAPIVRGESHVVYGSRFLQPNRMFYIQRLQNRAMTWLTNVVLGQRLTDVETGHKVFSREVAQQVDLREDGFEFEIELTQQIIRHGFTIIERPTRYTARTREQGKKLTFWDGVTSVLTLLKCRFR